MIESKKREKEKSKCKQNRNHCISQKEIHLWCTKRLSALIGWSSTSLAAKRISTHLCLGGLQFEKGLVPHIILKYMC